MSITDSEVYKEFHILPMPPVPPEAWKWIEEAQKANERATGKANEQEEHPIERKDR